MSMMDLAGALGGTPPPPGGAPSSIQVGGDPGAGPDAGAPPDDQGGDSISHLDDAEASLQAFIQVDPDEVDRAKAGQALKIILDLKAANQKSNDAGDLKSLRRALGPGGPGAASGGPPAGMQAGGPSGY